MHLLGGFLKSESDNRLFCRWMLVPDRAPALTIIIARGLHFTGSAMPPNVYPTSTQCLPDVILRRSFTRPSTALGDWRPGNEARPKYVKFFLWHSTVPLPSRGLIKCLYLCRVHYLFLWCGSGAPLWSTGQVGLIPRSQVSFPDPRSHSQFSGLIFSSQPGLIPSSQLGLIPRSQVSFPVPSQVSFPDPRSHSEIRFIEQLSANH